MRRQLSSARDSQRRRDLVDLKPAKMWCRHSGRSIRASPCSYQRSDRSGMVRLAISTGQMFTGKEGKKQRKRSGTIRTSNEQPVRRIVESDIFTVLSYIYITITSLPTPSLTAPSAPPLTSSSPSDPPSQPTVSPAPPTSMRTPNSPRTR